MFIEITSLTKIIHKTAVLNSISLRLESGKIYGLRGKNGSGKTMLMRAICGLIEPTKGTVNINGDILGKDISFPKSVGALIENPSFLSGYTGLKNLQILASIQNRITEEQIEDTLKAVGLDPGDTRKYRKYSLGMKQRLGIAAAIMEKPDLIILDEPINALDEKGVELAQRILHDEKQRGALIIVACHDREELDALSDEIYTIDDGRIIDHVPAADTEGKKEREITVEKAGGNRAAAKGGEQFA